VVETYFTQTFGSSGNGLYLYSGVTRFGSLTIVTGIVRGFSQENAGLVP
jgi:hypothetical protein